MSHFSAIARNQVHVQKRIVMCKNSLMLSGEKSNDISRFICKDIIYLPMVSCLVLL
jgi:hypothetical protein